MNKQTVRKSIEEAKRFLSLAKSVQGLPESEEVYWSASKHTAALKRASMDLTRALAEMRKPG